MDDGMGGAERLLLAAARASGPQQVLFLRRQYAVIHEEGSV